VTPLVASMIASACLSLRAPERNSRRVVGSIVRSRRAWWIRVCAAPTGSRNAIPISLSDPNPPGRDASSATPSETRAAAHACNRAAARR
jgi:hypothetical protein